MASGGPPLDEADREFLRRRSQQPQEDALQRVRDAAEKWRNGLGAFAATVTVLVVVKDPATVSGFSVAQRVAVVASTLLAIASGIGGTIAALRAAVGLPVLRATPADLAGLVEDQVAALRRAIRLLRLAVALSLAMVAFMFITIALSWLLPQDDEQVRVGLTSQQTLCGTLTRIDDQLLELRIAGHDLQVPRSSVLAVSESSHCGG